MDLRRQYEDAFMEGNEWVRSEYFPDRKSLFESNQIPCVSDSGFQPSELDQIAQMISAIWLDKTSGNLGFYKNRSFQIVYIIWRLKRKILWITKNLTSRWRRMWQTAVCYFAVFFISFNIKYKWRYMQVKWRKIEYSKSLSGQPEKIWLYRVIFLSW